VSSYGVIASGFLPMTQQNIIDNLNTQLSAAYGQQVNTSPESNLGVLVGILSEPMALLWQVTEAVYWSAFPAGAEGVAVDNQLAQQGLRRLPASPTVTNPTTAKSAIGTTLRGLVLGGTPGRVITARSLILTTDPTPFTFTLDSDTSIEASTNGVQNIVLSSTPTSGSVELSIVDTLGTTLTTPTLMAPLTASSIQTAINALQDPANSTFYFSDVVVTGSGSSFIVSFGAGTPLTGNPSSGAIAQPPIAIVSNSLITVSGGITTAVNAATVVVEEGSPAQGVGSATCTQNGPVSVAAGSLSVIGSPQSGWASVTNQIDCIPGTNTESDADAMLRKAANQYINGSRTVASIASRVQAVSGVISVVHFENKTNCAVQNINFSTTPTTGSYALQFQLGRTSSISPTASAADIQAAINSISGYNVVVTGNVEFGFIVDFNGSQGGQAQPLIQVVLNTTAVNVEVTFGRPPHSFEIVVEGGADVDVATAIQSAQPDGIGSYGAPSSVVTGNATGGSSTLTVASVTNIGIGNQVSGPGILTGTSVVSLGANVLLSQPAGVSGSGTYTFTNAITLSDSQGNLEVIAFSRPIQVLPFLAVSLLTDYYNVPGNSSSGINPSAQFSPANIPTLQQDLVGIGSEVPMGGLIVGQGSNGLVGAFNNVPGIIGYALAIAIGSQPTMPSAISPTVPPNIRLLPEQLATFEVINVTVSWS
jgi:uncharacterized phage protein gp47/JayE